VYLATENSTGNKVAIKQIIVDRQVNKQVVVNEISLMKLCRHSAVVQFLDSFLVNGTLWVCLADFFFIEKNLFVRSYLLIASYVKFE
jgi:serine/threonine protein kinase